MMTERDARLAKHITDLAAAFKVRLSVRKDMPPDLAAAGFSRFTGQRLIKIAPVTGETTYAVALHELGHCLSPMGMLRSEMSKDMRSMNRLTTKRDVALQLEEERAAWDWAEHYALEWTPAMQAVKKMCLGAYERRAWHVVRIAKGKMR